LATATANIGPGIITPDREMTIILKIIASTEHL